MCLVQYYNNGWQLVISSLQEQQAMAKIRKFPKWPNPPIVGGGRRKEKDQSMRQNQGYTSSMGVAEAHGKFRRSERHHSETTFVLVGDAASNEVKKRYWSPSLEGGNKAMTVKGEYNRFTVT